MSTNSIDLQSVLLERMLNGGGIDAVSSALAEYFDAFVCIEYSGSAYASADRPDKDAVVYNLEQNIHAGGNYLGHLTVERSQKPFSDAEKNVFKKVTEFVALQLLQDKKIADIELRLRGSFIEDLISTNISDPGSVKKRARAIAYDITVPHRVLVAEIANISHVTRHQNQNSTALESFKSELVKSVHNRLNQLSMGMVMHRNNETVMLVRIDANDHSLSSVKSLSEEIINFVYSQYNAQMYIGIGSACFELSDFSKSYHAAKKSLEIGEYMITEGQVRSLEQFSVHALFLSTVKPVELYNYARAHLDKLLAYDKKNGSELLKTLQEYLYLRNNVEKTARSISLSISGLKYRLKRIEKIIGLELNDYKVSFDLQLALIIMQLYGEYRIRSDSE